MASCRSSESRCRRPRRLTVALGEPHLAYSPVVRPLCVHTGPQSLTEMAYPAFGVLELHVGDLEARHGRLLHCRWHFLVGCASPEPDRQRRWLILRSIALQDRACWPRLSCCS